MLATGAWVQAQIKLKIIAPKRSSLINAWVAFSEVVKTEG